MYLDIILISNYCSRQKSLQHSRTIRSQLVPDYVPPAERVTQMSQAIREQKLALRKENATRDFLYVKIFFLSIFCCYCYLFIYLLLLLLLLLLYVPFVLVLCTQQTRRSRTVATSRDPRN